MELAHALSPAPPVLEVSHLTVATTDGGVTIVDDLSLHVRQGEMLALLGESGCGKSMTSLAIMRLAGAAEGLHVSGTIRLSGEDLGTMSERAMRRVRGRRLSMIFQNPMSALNPLRTVGAQIAETLRAHVPLSRAEARARSVALLDEVGITDPARRYDAYPHELSGGMCQRVMIAMAIACDPALLIADEPTTALDVTIQKQIMDLLHTLRTRRGMAILMITHDLGVVASYADRVAVMYAGRIIESGDVETMFARPDHPYTGGLLASMPDLDIDAERFYAIPGSVPDLRELPSGCTFAPRCAHATDSCRIHYPSPSERAGGGFVRCWHPLQANA
ncbi:ABC transporter ATP-binding protein [Gluconacetobacter tumulisoli]|uniref:ABC transporter ATP-binding protein n=1 Tax=Gluconacetobacter tumulisoli TaxID=1286189 RepID=A0A7W4K9X5_9PROT|nr:ABC transporter ATP-binding protein [Gluconacetobacter tumulisoli]MBB2203046.1 ABC transporter ATP-binding protein [Gluconacetobacter tumulisoli]